MGRRAKYLTLAAKSAAARQRTVDYHRSPRYVNHILIISAHWIITAGARMPERPWNSGRPLDFNVHLFTYCPPTSSMMLLSSCLTKDTHRYLGTPFTHLNPWTNRLCHDGIMIPHTRVMDRRIRCESERIRWGWWKLCTGGTCDCSVYRRIGERWITWEIREVRRSNWKGIGMIWWRR